jgi:hypothetical protein
LQRLVTVFFGLILAMVGGALVLIALNSYWAARVYESTLSHYYDEGIGAIDFSFMVAPLFTLVSAAVAAVVGEIAHIRSALYYIVTGGMAAVVIPFIMAAPVQQTTYAPYFSLIATAGFAGGLIYWVFAGRSA